jgi:hypothetical protein
MANFASIANVLEGTINSQLSSARINQGVWEWYNALQRIVSANKDSGTVRVVGPRVAVTASNTIEANAVTLYGVLIDNGGTENAFLELSNVAVTGGNDDTLGPILYTPTVVMNTYVFPSGLSFSAGLYYDVVLATNTALEAGTEISAGNLLLHKTIFVYTEA